MNRFEQVREIISNVLEVPVELITLESVKNDFERWDSLGQLNLVMEMESVFDISVPIEFIAQIDCVKAMMDVVEELAK